MAAQQQQPPQQQQQGQYSVTSQTLTRHLGANTLQHLVDGATQYYNGSPRYTCAVDVTVDPTMHYAHRPLHGVCRLARALEGHVTITGQFDIGHLFSSVHDEQQALGVALREARAALPQLMHELVKIREGELGYTPEALQETLYVHVAGDHFTYSLYLTLACPCE